MNDYANLVDICSVKQRERSSRKDNALFFLEQIKDHKKFRVDRDVVEIHFSATEKTLTMALASYLEQKNRL
ncbi:MAG: hypothetical protein FWG87_01450 [Defluviitaleaceae bacterium]|nr:hypothetical protein [Defluviitaleaceae bacterium]